MYSIIGALLYNAHYVKLGVCDKNITKKMKRKKNVVLCIAFHFVSCNHELCTKQNKKRLCIIHQTNTIIRKNHHDKHNTKNKTTIQC